ncbi:MAG: 3'-5' exonuclease [Acidobacteria bacterium]|nr:3'-5' exonuclease [Acidobacteriota bacterium]MCA1608855.1 3'-5' exonuclease [Acidobacteriota bacterium]
MLKHKLRDLTLFFDLEWVPDAESARRIFDMPEETTELEAIERLWREAPGYSADCPRPFVKYLFSRIVSIAFLSRSIVWRDGVRRVEFKLHSLPILPLDDRTPDESYLIERFLYYVGEREPHLVGFNSSESDLQVLIQRGLIHEISAARFCERPPKPWEGRDYFYRYGEEHLDLLKHFSNGHAKPKLNELARLCGFPGKLDTCGEQVVDLWLAGDIQKIVEYNQIDALNTYLIWLRFVHFCGKLKEEDYAEEQLEFRQFLVEESVRPEKAHLKRFLKRWSL